MSAETVPFEREGRGRPSLREVAEAILAEHRLVQDRWGTVYRYDGRRWREITPATLNAIAYRHDDAAGLHGHRRREVVELVKTLVHREDLRWGRVADHEIAAANGVVDCLTGRIRPHRPEDWLETVIPWEWRPLEAGLAAEAPVFAEALETWLGDDGSAVAALQEFFGYVALSHARFKKALFLKGPSNTGKSAVVLLLVAFVGADQYCSIPVDQMHDPILLVDIKGKRLNVMTELPASAVVRDGGFKTLVSGEEPVKLNHKYGEVETYRPTAKHVIASNVFPDITDRTSATINRLLLVPFTRVVPEAIRDPDLIERLAPEMPAILAWAVEGARRLVEARGQFTVVEAGQREIAAEQAESNPLALFVAEQLEPFPGETISLSRLGKLFNERMGTRWESRRLGKTLRAMGLRTAQARTSEWIEGALRSISTRCLLDYRPRVRDAVEETEKDDGSML
jgi:P4 family phage/plasmid primase-like protien